MTARRGLSIGKKLGLGFGASAVIIAAIIALVYGAFRDTSATVAYQSEVFSTFQQTLTSLSESQWRTVSRVQSMYVAETVEAAQQRHAEAARGFERSQAMLEALLQPRFDTIHALRIAAADEFRLTEQSVSALRAADVDAETLEAIAPLVDAEVMSRRDFEFALRSLPALADDAKTVGLVLRHAAQEITLREALHHLREIGADISRISNESLLQIKRLLQFAGDRERIVDTLALRHRALAPLRTELTSPFLDALDVHLSKLVLGGSAAAIRSNKRRAERGLRDIARRGSSAETRQALATVENHIDEAAKLLEENAKTRDTTIFLQHSLSDRQDTIDAQLRNIAELLSVKGESLSQDVLGQMSRFLVTVAALGVAGITLSLVLGWLIRRSVLAPLGVMLTAAERVADGDLAHSSSLQTIASRSDEYGSLGTAFVSMEGGLREMIRGLQRGVRNLTRNAESIAEAAQQGAATASEQVSTVAQVTATTEELLQTSRISASSAEEVVDASEKAAASGRTGEDAVLAASRVVLGVNERVSEIVDKIRKLEERNKLIGGIVDTVNGLAEQSNLLAVNASIEAAKAGEQGRGFAVVAAEVRRLAEQSKRSTDQIRGILEDTRRATNAVITAAKEGSKEAERGREAIDSTRDLIAELAVVLDENAERARQILGSASQQASAVGEIVDAMESVSEASAHGSQGARDLESSARALSALSVNLEELISGYRLETKPGSIEAPAAGRSLPATGTARPTRRGATDPDPIRPRDGAAAVAAG